MGRSPCCDESGLKKGPWTPEEDQKLAKHIQKHGHGSWRALPKLAGLNRCGKSCRLRWTNYLRPDIKRGNFSQEEEQTILNLHSILGNKWSAIASNLPGRTDNEIKNFWNTHLKKKLINMGFDPMTHRPRTDIFSSIPHLIALANLKELIDHHSNWEQQAARLQSEAAQLTTLKYLQYVLQPYTPPPNNNISSSSVTDIEINNLLTSLSTMNSESNVAPFLETPTQSSQMLPFSHMPDLEIPCNFETTLNNKEERASQVSNFSSSPSPPQPLGYSTGDACSTSSYGGVLPQPSFWSEILLEDPLFNEIA